MSIGQILSVGLVVSLTIFAAWACGVILFRLSTIDDPRFAVACGVGAAGMFVFVLSRLHTDDDEDPEVS